MLIPEFLRLCLSIIGSKPKGHNVILSRERASPPPPPHAILPRLLGSTAGPRETQAESPGRAVPCWGQGMGQAEAADHEQVHYCDMETRPPWDFWK